MIGPLASPLIECSSDSEVEEHLYRRALAFLRCGGAVTLTEWNGMSDAERVAMERAYRDRDAVGTYRTNARDCAPGEIDALPAMERALDAAEGGSA